MCFTFSEEWMVGGVGEKVEGMRGEEKEGMGIGKIRKDNFFFFFFKKRKDKKC